MTLVLHIGGHKTGTSSIQNMLWRNSDLLASLGWSYPLAGRSNGPHHNVAYQLRSPGQFVPDAGSLEACIQEATSAPNGLISSEELEYLTPVQITRLKRALGDAQTCVLVYLRRQDSLIPSSFAQQAKTGARVPGLDEYLGMALSHPRYDLLGLVSRWADAFGREALMIGVMSARNAGPLLYEDFLGRIGLGGEASRFQTPRQPFNPTPSWARVELIRRVSLRIRGDGPPLPTARLKEVQAAVAVAIGQDPALCAAQKPGLSQAQWQRVADRFSIPNAELASNFDLGFEEARSLTFSEPSAEFTCPLDETHIHRLALEILRTIGGSMEQEPVPEVSPLAGTTPAKSGLSRLVDRVGLLWTQGRG